MKIRAGQKAGPPNFVPTEAGDDLPAGVDENGLSPSEATVLDGLTAATSSNAIDSTSLPPGLAKKVIPLDGASAPAVGGALLPEGGSALGTMPGGPGSVTGVPPGLAGWLTAPAFEAGVPGTAEANWRADQVAEPSAVVSLAATDSPASGFSAQGAIASALTSAPGIDAALPRRLALEPSAPTAQTVPATATAPAPRPAADWQAMPGRLPVTAASVSVVTERFQSRPDDASAAARTLEAQARAGTAVPDPVVDAPSEIVTSPSETGPAPGDMPGQNGSSQTAMPIVPATATETADTSHPATDARLVATPFSAAVMNPRAEPVSAAPHENDVSGSPTEEGLAGQANTAAIEPAALPLRLSSYVPPLFNRRLDTNGVDDALILLQASFESARHLTVRGRRFAPPVLEALPVEGDGEHDGAEFVSASPQPAMRSRTAWPAARFARALSATPIAPARIFRAARPRAPHASTYPFSHRNPFMSDPRSAGAVERAAFWVRADACLQHGPRWPQTGTHPLHRGLTRRADDRRARNVS